MVALCAAATAREIAPAELGALPEAPVTVLGEVHDNPLHHANQAAAVAAIGPTALGFEMLTPEQAAGARPGLAADAAALEEALQWNAAGWPDFAFYYPIFAAAPDARIYGAGVPREAARAAFGNGAAAAFGAGAARFGLDRALPEEEQATREAEQMASHCDALPTEILPGFVEAQRLRDARLAEAALVALDETGGPVVVITGNGHARRDRGIPFMLGIAAPEVQVLSVGQFEETAPDVPAFDLWLVTEPAPREDPCAAFR